MGKEWGSLRPRARQQHAENCAGKTPIESYRLADALAKKRSRGGKKNHPYRCGVCGKFHLGSAMSRKAPTRRRLVEQAELEDIEQ